MLELSLIVKSLWRGKLAPFLIIVQMAISVAIISNALFFIADRHKLIHRPTGVAEAEIFKLWSKQNPNQGDIEQTLQRDLTMLRAVPDVLHAAPINSVPMSNMGSTMAFTYEPDPGPGARYTIAGFFSTSEAGLDTLGLELVAGRNFMPNEVEFFSGRPSRNATVAIVSQALADKMFPDGNALDQTVYLGSSAVTIVGIVKRLIAHMPKEPFAEDTALIPVIEKREYINYIVRTSSKDVEARMGEMAALLRDADSSRLIGHEQTLAQIKREAYSGDYAMIYLMCAVIALLALINALGIFGLTSLWVGQRRKQIGIRRALGASRQAILRYFLVENCVLTGFSALLGAVLATAASVYLAREYAAEMMPWFYLPATSAALVAITLGAALLPALRASGISPAAAVANG